MFSDPMIGAAHSALLPTALAPPEQPNTAIAHNVAVTRADGSLCYVCHPAFRTPVSGLYTTALATRKAPTSTH